MRKVFSAIAAVVLGCVLIVVFASCSDNNPSVENITSITDIERYSDMQNRADKIGVEFDNGTQGGFLFTITDEEEIAEIMSIIFNTSISYGGKQNEIPPMGNTFLTVYQGEKTYTLGHRFISDGENYYSFQTSELAEKITELATAHGAYDTEAGVIYKVIDLQDIENAAEEKITVSDKTAMLALLKDSYGDCGYFYLFDSQDLAEQYYSPGITERTDAGYQYSDTITMEEGKLLLIYHIYQNYNAASYYITSPSVEEFTNLGNAAHIELAFGLWHSCYLNIQIVCP